MGGRGVFGRAAARFGACLFAIVFGVALPEPAAADGERVVFRMAKPVEYRLVNGLRVVLHEVHRQPLVAIRMSYGVGSRDDPEDHDGLAHLVEHLTFRGSRHVAPLESLKLIERIGATDWNGTTSLDSTDYFCTVPVSALPSALWLERERMAFTLERFDEAGLAMEKKIVTQELKLRAGMMDRLWKHVGRAVYPEGHPYYPSFSEIGDVDAATLNDARWFFQRAYRPTNATLAIVGDFEVSSVRKLVSEYFADVREPVVRMSRKPAPRIERKGAVVELRASLRYETTALHWVTEEVGPYDSTAVRSIGYLLGGSHEPSLPTELLERRGLVSDVDWSRDRSEFSSEFEIRAALRKDVKHEVVERVVLDRVRRLRDELIDEPTLAGIRQQLQLDELDDIADIGFLAQAHVQSIRLDGRPYSVGDALRSINALTAARIQAAAQRHLDARSVVIVRTRQSSAKRYEGDELVTVNGQSQ